MNKSELITEVADRSGISKKETEITLNATLEAIADALRQGEKIQLVGFGVFEVKNRAARTGRNPKTKEPINIPASRTPQFKAGKTLKEIVNI